MEELLYKVYHFLPKSFRFGRQYVSEYRRVYRSLKSSEYLSKEQLEDMQLIELRKIVQYAYKNVPYYTHLFDELKLDVINSFNLDLFKQIPYLTKEIVRANTDALISKEYKKEDLVAHATGGSTGEPCVFYYEKTISDARENAFVQHLYDRLGYKDSDTKVYLRDVSDKKLALNEKKYWFKEKGVSTWWFAVRYLDENHLSDFVKVLYEINPKWIVGYPSAIYFLCKYIKDHPCQGLLHKLKGVIFMSENVYPHQLSCIKEALCNKSLFGDDLIIFSAYGHTEHGCIAGTCEKRFVYHIQPEYGYSEFDNGELITTGFTNYAMPLIRYRTQDIFTLSEEECSCGRHYQLVKSIDGRTDDVLVHADGRYENANTLDFTRGRLALLLDGLQRYQFIQSKVGECTMRVVAKEGKDESFYSELDKEINEYFGVTLKIIIEKADKPILGKRGKERLIINTIS